MDVVDGNCVLCTKNTDVLNTVFCNQFLDLLKAHYFEVNNDDFKQFSKLFKARYDVHSFCVSCAFKLNCYFETRNACNEVTKTGTSGRTCSHCNNTDYITKCSKQLKTDFQSVFKGIKNNARNITHTCLRCLLAINAFKAIKESITNLLEEDSGSDSSDSEQTTTMKKSKPSKVATPQSLRKRKSSDADDKNENQTSKRLRRDSTRKSFEEVKKGKKSTRRASSVLDKKLSHLNNVNAETIERDMHLSYQVVTDQKLMFDIPFVDCAGIESTKLNGKNIRQKSKKPKLSAPDEESVIDISSSEEQEESSTRSIRRSKRATQRKSQRISSTGNDTETTVSSTLSSSRPKRNVSQKTPIKLVNSKKIVIESSDDEAETTSSKKVIPPRSTKKNVPTPKLQKKINKESTVPIFKTPKIKLKGPVKIQQKEKIKYSCKKCAKVLKMKYMVVLHELEHDCSYSPMISVEKSDLLAIKEDLKLKNRTDDEKPVDDVETETNDLATDENTETEKETDTDVTENNEDENLKSLRLDDENKDEEKNADEETDNPAENEDDESNEIQDEEKDKMDVSIEKDAVEETDKEVDDKVDDRISEQEKDATDITSDKEEETAGSEKESDSIEDEATPESEMENKASSDNEEETNDTATESATQETDEVTEEDTTTKEVRSPKRKEKSDKDVSPEKQDSSKDEVEPEKKTMEAEETTTNEDDQQNASNDEETDATEKVASPKRKSKTPSPKKQNDSKENGDDNNEHDNEETIEVDVDVASKEDVRSPKRASKSPPPKRAKSASPKKADAVDDAEELNTAVAAAGEELSKDIPKDGDKNLSPISSDNESNTEPNEYVSKGSDISDNEVEQPVSKDQKSNGFSNDCEIEEFTLKLSSSEESNSPDKKNTSDQENESTNNILPDETTNSVHKTPDQDTFQMVENLLQNLGA